MVRKVLDSNIKNKAFKSKKDTPNFSDHDFSTGCKLIPSGIMRLTDKRNCNVTKGY